MNTVILSGRMVRDPEFRYTTGEKPMAIARFSLAVDRRGRRKEGEQSADFPGCVAFGKTAEFIEKYGRKGLKLEIRGRLQTGSYEKDGRKVYTTDVVVDETEFAESKAAPQQAQETKPERTEATYRQESFMDIPDDADDAGLPFN